MPTLFPNRPYFDDYDEDKQFQQILFRPGRAVQARELTQIQTLAQKQIERFGNDIYKNGTIITGCEFNLDLKIEYLKINDLDASSNPFSVNTILKGYSLTGLTSGVKAYVILTADGLETSAETKTIFLKYTAANGTTKTFQASEQIEVRDQNNSLILTVVALSSSPTGKGAAFTLGDGIFYVNGMFVKHLKQTIILNRYTNYPTCKIGLSIEESVIDSDQDNSLLDPALGSSNYFATGADRYKVTTVLQRKNQNDFNTENFFLIAEIEAGFYKTKIEETEYGQLLDTIAARTFEESGNYTVKPFNIRIREHLNTGNNNGVYLSNTNPSYVSGTTPGDANKLAIGVEPGVAYVNGYRVLNGVTEYLPIDKGTDTTFEEQQPVSFGFGNYLIVEEVVGPWDIDNAAIVSLRSANADAITNTTFGSTAAPGSEIGNARVRAFVHESGISNISNTTYRLYLYDVKMSTANSFANVRSVFYNSPSGSDSIADVVLDPGGAILKENTFNTSLFKFPQKAIKQLRDLTGSIDNSFEFTKTFTPVTIETNGTFSIQLSAGSSEEFPFSAGPITPTAIQDNFVVVLNQAATTANLTGTLSVYSANTRVNGSGTNFTTQLKSGDRITLPSGNTFRVSNVTSSTVLYLTSTPGASEIGKNFRKSFGIGEHIDFTITGSSGSARSANLVSDTQVNFDIEETLTAQTSAKVIATVQRTDGKEVTKTLRKNRYVKINCNTAGTSGIYNIGFSDIYRIAAIYHGSTYSESNTDVTNQFTLDNGQRDNFYRNGRILKKQGSSLNLTSSSRLLVKLDYFYHDTSLGVGFFSVDSYPVDDTEATPNTIKTENIPVYISPTSGIKYDLRDCIDIRSRFSDTASDATTIAGASENPSESTSISIPLGGLRTGKPNSVFRTDLSYYLSRRDRIYIDKDNIFGTVRGISDIYPNAPEEPPQAMSIAIINIPPYPSLAPTTAKNSGRLDYLTNPKLLDNRRYTMKDIGAINQRINRLEYYAALNFLEKNASDAVIPSADTGLDRFKNGFLTDNFTGHGVGNVYDPSYKVSVDNLKGELRPYFLIDNVDLILNEAESQNILMAPRDAILTVSSVTGTFTRNQTISQGLTTGLITYVVGSKIYVEDVSGTFTAGVAVATPTGSATLSSVSTPTKGELVTLSYSHVLYNNNEFATKPRNCVGELLFTWVGEIALNPPADNWTDVHTNPEVIVNFDSNYDNWAVTAEAWGTQWNDWQTNWSGVTDTRTATAGAVNLNQNTGAVTQAEQTVRVETVTERQSRAGTVLNVVPETVNYQLGNRIVDTTVIPFIRSQVITFNASRLKPSTRLYAFFDNEKVSAYCRPIGGNYGDPLVTDTNGNITGEFRIPNDDTLRFRTGQRLFKLNDDPESRGGFITTSAVEEFSASGINVTQEGTTISTRLPRLSYTTVSDERTTSSQTVSVEDPRIRDVGQVITPSILASELDTFRESLPPPQVNITNITNIEETIINNITEVTQVIERRAPAIPDPFFLVGDGDGGDGGGDPISQTFFTPGTGFGLFLTRIDLFFRTKSATLPITLQVREVVNSYPSTRVLPFGSVTLDASAVNVSEDASAPTPFPFISPVYLKPNTEYCFVILPAGNNPDYNIWVSELGENQLGTENRVSEQPHLGMLFVSANDRTWTAVQSEDLKFRMWRADFDIDTVAKVVLNNDNSDYLTISNLSGGVFNAGDLVTFASGGNAIVKEYVEANQTIQLLKPNNSTAFVRSKVVPSGNITTYTANANVFGDGTLFSTESYANAVIYSANTGSRIGKVKTIINDTQIVLEANSTENLSDELFLIYDELQDSDSNVRAAVETIENKKLTLFQSSIPHLEFTPTVSKWEYKIRASSTGLLSDYSTYLVNENLELPFEANISSHSNEIRNLSNTKSFAIKTDFYTPWSSVSPVLDLYKNSAVIVENFINNDATNETTNQGNALARYISKRVELAEDQDAEDLQVFVSGYKPPGTDIKVYARFLHATDSTPFNELDYIELQSTTSALTVSDAKNQQDFKEFTYVIPSSSLTGPNGELQYTSDGITYTGYKYFAIKIVLLSTSAHIVPKVKDYRAIALQI